MLAFKQLAENSFFLYNYVKPNKQSSSIDSSFLLQTLAPRSVVLNSLHFEYLSLLSICHLFRPTGQRISPQDFTPVNLRQVFINDFNQKKDATSLFLLKLSDFTIWSTV